MSIDFPKEEDNILTRWKEIKAFERQIELSEGRPHYAFYDGPPFATYVFYPSHHIYFESEINLVQRPSPLWPPSGKHHQRHHSSILVYERVSRGEALWVGYTWNSD
jgi:hypothetical protein